MFRNTLLLLIMTTTLGCTSFRTTIMQRGADGRLYLNSPEPKTRGIPVKLKVPTHVEVRIVEHFFLQQIDGENGAAEYSEAPLTDAKGTALRALEVRTAPKYTDKVFTVDFRRPAGGILNLTKIDMDDQQYFQSIQAAYEERTLQQINTALGTIKPKTQGTDTPADAEPAEGDEVEIPADDNEQTLSDRVRTVAIARFDISQPDWEYQLQCFVDQHVTGCYGDCNIAN